MRNCRWTIALKAAVLAVAILVAPTGAQALETDLGMGAFAAFSVGVSMLDTSGIDDYLEPADVDSFGEGYLDFGGEFTGVLFERMIFGMNGAFLARENSGPDLDVLLTSGSFHFYGGYVLFETHRLRGYPIVGFGYSNVHLRLDGDYSPLPLANQAGIDFVSLDGLGQGAGAEIATQEELSLNYGAMTVQAAFHLEYYHPFVGHPESFAFVLTGVRLGGEVEVVSTGWYLDGDSMHGAEPDFRFDRGFIRLVFGFGGAGPYEPEVYTRYPDPEGIAQDEWAPEPERHQ